MSSEAVGWVYRHSPYKAGQFAVHHAIADSVNDMYGYELWASQTTIAEKARVSRSTVNRAIQRMIDDDLLELLEDNSADGRPNRYRFHMPDTDPVFTYQSEREGVSPRDTPPGEGVSPRDTGVSHGATGGVSPRDTNPSDNPRDEPNDTTAREGQATETANLLADAIGSVPGLKRPDVDDKFIAGVGSIVPAARAAIDDDVDPWKAITYVIRWSAQPDCWWYGKVDSPKFLRVNFHKMWPQALRDYLAERRGSSGVRSTSGRSPPTKPSKFGDGYIHIPDDHPRQQQHRQQQEDDDDGQ